jgi:glycosyltransferase involved in cell wall biosynthesis
MKVVSITCYFDPHYIRSQVLEQALLNLPDVELITIRNMHKGLLRYPEVLGRLLKFKFSRTKPDVYLLNFRGYELLPFVLLLAGRKPVIFDEMINPVEVVTEHRKQRAGTFVGALMNVWSIFALFYYWLLGRCRVILADTEAHKVFTASASHVPLDRYVAIPVSTDETAFKPNTDTKIDSERPAFQVFYYGSMVPLHGVQYLIEAAELLKHIPDISFLIAGRTTLYKSTIAAAQKAGANINCLDWVEFAKLPGIMANSSVCVGGPFGNTVQSRYVITTKTYQSLAGGVATLVGQNEATSELFHDKDNALVVPQANAQALADEIEWAYKHQPELTAIGANGRKLYEQHFSSQAVQKTFTDILQKLASER